MPAYGFQPRWIEPLKQGRKLTTIRAMRKDGWTPVIGTTLYAYMGYRTKQARRLFTSPIVRVSRVTIAIEQGESEFDGGMCLVVDGTLLGMRAANKIARADGFKDVHQLFDFFVLTHGLCAGKKFLGHLIEWRQPVENANFP